LTDSATQATGLAGPARTFDEQALRYDARAGLPTTVSAAVAQAIRDRADAGADDLVLEVGAGTGEIGVHLARLPVQYVGLDASAAMLDVFRARAAGDSPSLIVADGNQPWPLPDGSATVVFASRVVHLLEPDHVVRETLRVCRPAGLLILGRVVRDRDGIAERLRRQRLELLTAAGISARHGEAGTRRVIAGVVAHGGESLGRHIVAEWISETTPAAVIADWESMTRMGSVAVDAETRDTILDALRDWGRTQFGDLDRSQASPAHYAVDIVRVP
jgi:ubiquinone/menaquinone biosynthesis C-methylase UbiE